ncbi:MAG: Catalase [Rhodocyclales bacterium]|nr:Catalase [Rhodocyclales bacterium]
MCATRSVPANPTGKKSRSSPSVSSSGSTAELHQQAGAGQPVLTTNQGIPVSDNQNSLRVGARGPTLLEDFVLREKITHFDHERIPERIVHARGSAAHGYFQPYKSLAKWTRAAFLQDPKKQTPVFVRFSTVAGERGSFDLARDVRGFAVKFYTEEGNFDLVGNNIPVFFIQDAIKFPDLIHAVKPEPDRGFPQAASAHDTFWDFVSLMPESIHMVTWAMSDRAIPRSYRMMEGFGVHTFRLVNAANESFFVKFHWRPTIGSASVVWDEAVKINGADPDFHRRDLWEAIDKGSFPEYELALQVFDQATADKLQFDVLDPTKIIPEEIIPLEVVGKLVLNRNPDNFFAETEQVAFCPANIVPGLDFSNDPLLQGRLFSYLDTQLSRLGGPNFNQIPINQPKCPMHNLQRDGIMQMGVPKGRVAYEPNSLDPQGPRESAGGFASFGAKESGERVRLRPESFSDHYSQARQFFNSMTPPEQNHIVSAYAFELGKVESVQIRRRVLGHLDNISADLGAKVADLLGMQGQADAIAPRVTPVDLPPSPALSILAKAPATLKGRKVGILLGEGYDPADLAAIRAAIVKEQADVATIAAKVGGVPDVNDEVLAVDMALKAAPSVLFDAVVILAGPAGDVVLSGQAPAVEWLKNAFVHLKCIALLGVETLVTKANIKPDAGVILLKKSGKTISLKDFIEAAKKGRVWNREDNV